VRDRDREREREGQREGQRDRERERERDRERERELRHLGRLVQVLLPVGELRQQGEGVVLQDVRSLWQEVNAASGNNTLEQ